MAHPQRVTYRVAIAGASSLLGKELKEVLEQRNFPADDLVLLDEPEMAGTLTEAAGEATFIRSLAEDSLESAQIAFFAGQAEDAAGLWTQAQRAGCTVIDLSGGLAAVAGARIAIPSLDPGGVSKEKPSAYRSPSAPALIACTLATALCPFSPQRLAAVFLMPVSERGQSGVDELESQTASLLSFRPFDQTVFDAQVAFNLLNRYGGASRARLEKIRDAISADVRAFLDGKASVPAIQLVQAPVFYGSAFATFVDFSSPPNLEELERALSAVGTKIAAKGDSAPTNVSVAGETQIHLAAVESDPGVPGGVWLWGAADNLRLAATNAVRIAEEVLAVED